MGKYLISLSFARAFLLSMVVVSGFLLPNPVAAKSDFLKSEEVVSEQVLESPAVDSLESPVSMVAFTDSIEAGKPFWVALHLNIEEGWKTYWKNPGESGFAFSVEWEMPEGFTAEEILWPTPKKSVVQEFTVYGYDKPVTFLTKITPSHNADLSSIKAKVSWLICNDETCLPKDAELQVSKKGTLSELEQAMQKMPSEVADAELKDSTLFIPKSLYESVPSKIEFYPENGILKNDLKVTQDEKGTYIHLESLGGDAVKGVLHFQGDTNHSYTIDLSKSKPLDFTATTYGEESSSFAMILLFAFVGGMILNLMPCVLPVVSLKVLSFINMAGQSRKKTMMHGLLFSMGVLVSFWALAAIILVLRGLGHSVGWGFQLQNETFVGILAALLLLLALWLFGVFEMGFSLSAKTGDVVEKAKKKQKEGGKLFGSFLSGVLATAVATPCSGPFLGTALGVAVTVPAIESLMIFTWLGFGMAFPYLILAAFPKLLRFLPKPGAWMDTFKQLMGFMMLLVVIWLVWVFVSQSDSANILPLLVGFLALSFAAWAYGKFTTGFKKTITKTALLGLTMVSAFTGFYLVVEAGKNSTYVTTSTTASVENGWEKFSNEAINKLRDEGKGVFIDFTAKWCLLCQANLMVLKLPAIERKMEEMGVVKMMADWTRSDPSITQELARFGRNSVPLYIYYPPGRDSKPQVLPQVLTQDVVLESLEDAEEHDLKDQSN